MTRAELLQCTDGELLLHCRVDTFRGTGPGGQKRNKTESAVRLTLRENGISAFDDQSRSQHLNREYALKKLRQEIALSLREVAVPWNRAVPGLNSREYPVWIGAVFDALHETEFHLSEASAILGTTTGKLSKALSRDPLLCQLVNQERKKRALSLLRWN